MKRTRQIIRIDEDKCNGCGLCVPSCKEGALQIIDGKARLVSEVYCDGLGVCLGECPTGALTIEEHEAEEFVAPLLCGCPGTMVKTHRQWPIQLHLIPTNAPYLNGADLVLMADCTAFAYANAHQDFIRGRAVAIACPKLDDTSRYVEKLAEMIRINCFRSIEVVMMEVPCCGGLSALAEQAIEMSGVKLPLKKTIVGLEGNLI